jgi:hypothetical protein
MIPYDRRTATKFLTWSGSVKVKATAVKDHRDGFRPLCRTLAGQRALGIHVVGVLVLTDTDRIWGCGNDDLASIL